LQSRTRGLSLNPAFPPFPCLSGAFREVVVSSWSHFAGPITEAAEWKRALLLFVLSSSDLAYSVRAA